MASALLIDTSFSALPIYRALSELSSATQVIGGNKEDALAKSTHNYVHLDYSQLKELSSFVSKQKISHLIPGCNDLSYKAASYLGESATFPGLDSLQTTETLNNKREFRLFSEELGLPTPKLVNQSSPSFPVIIKPVDAFSGQGVSIVYGRELLKTAVEKAVSASNVGEYIIEEYWEGQLFSHSAFIENGKILIDFIVKEDSTAYPFAVDTSCVHYTLPKPALNNVRSAANRIAESLNLCDGLLHTQFILSGESIVIIEVTRRCPGDLYSMLIEHSTGFPYAKAYTLPFLGQKASSLKFTPVKQWVTRHTITSTDTQTFNSLKYNAKLLIRQWTPLARTGDVLRPAPKDRVGVLFFEAETEEEHKKLYGKTLKREIYTID